VFCRRSARHQSVDVRKRRSISIEAGSPRRTTRRRISPTSALRTYSKNSTKWRFRLSRPVVFGMTHRLRQT
jgi:hypothetical protein